LSSSSSSSSRRASGMEGSPQEEGKDDALSNVQFQRGHPVACPVAMNGRFHIDDWSHCHGISSPAIAGLGSLALHGPGGAIFATCKAILSWPAWMLSIEAASGRGIPASRACPREQTHSTVKLPSRQTAEIYRDLQSPHLQSQPEARRSRSHPSSPLPS